MRQYDMSSPLRQLQSRDLAYRGFLFEITAAEHPDPGVAADDDVGPVPAGDIAHRRLGVVMYGEFRVDLGDVRIVGLPVFSLAVVLSFMGISPLSVFYGFCIIKRNL